MIDHITLRVKNISKSKTFYDSLLQIIGYKILLGRGVNYYYISLI